MKYLVDDWASIKRTLQHKPLAIFLDFDGTLAPIAKTPDNALLPKRNKLLIERLSDVTGYKVAVVSGRSFPDLKSHVGIKKIVYVGNHGLEIYGPDINFASLISPQVKSTMEEVKNDLNQHLVPIKGVLLEDKGITFSLHYRLVNEHNLPKIKQIFTKICEPYRKQGRINIGSGKKVFEIRPPIVWNKGHAVFWLLKEYSLIDKTSYTPIYVGDDMTDEDAFDMLQDVGLTVLVGKHPSRANYYLGDTLEVSWLLEQILELSV